LAKIFLDELKKAIEWVNKNREEAANLAFDIMRQPVDRISQRMQISGSWSGED